MAIRKEDRAKAEAFWLKLVKDLNVGQSNVDLYAEFFKSLSMDNFEKLVERIESGKLLLPVYVRNMDPKVKGSFEQVIKVCKKYNIPLFERLILTDPISGEEFLTPEKACVLYLPVRRQIHHLLKKIALPEHDNVVNHLTGQVTGASKGASLTHPEASALEGKKYDKALIELKKLRGGDREAFEKLTNMLEETGGASIVPILQEGTVNQSVASLQYYLLGMNLNNNAVE